jgi:hypothetical protein
VLLIQCAKEHEGFPVDLQGFDFRGPQKGGPGSVLQVEKVPGTLSRDETGFLVAEDSIDPVLPTPEVAEALQGAAGQRID